MRTEDGSIIHECLSGKSEVFGLLVDKYKEGIYAFVYAELRDFHDAQDVTQEVFLEAYRDLRSLRRWESFVFWLYRIARRRCAIWFRIRSKRVDQEFIEDQDPKIVDAPSLDSYSRDQLGKSVRESLESLPAAYSEVLILRYFSGMNSKEIAGALGISPTAVRMRLSRARAQLREEIVAMMGTTFENQRLPTGFTFRIVEAVKRININPMPRVAALPWGISLALGVMLTIIGLSSYRIPNIPASLPPLISAQSKTQVLERGEIPVDIVKLSQITTISSHNGNSDGEKAMSPMIQNADANAAGIKLTPKDVRAGGGFASAVYMYGDYIIAGAPWQDSKKGAAYIFKYDGTSWREQAMLTAKDGVGGNPGDVFGSSVVITNDYAIVGAPYDDDMGENTGSVYIFRFNGGNWVDEAKLRPHGNTIKWCNFGDSISISGDYLIVGSPYESSLGGAIYIFQLVDSKWKEQAKLISSDWAMGDMFGISVSTSGDYAIVGAAGHPNNDLKGSAYIFRRVGDSWKEQAMLEAKDGDAGDQFGISVSISGNYAIVGANNDRDKGELSGSAYIFHNDGASWKQQAKLISSDLAEHDGFGDVVCISGNYVLVGASNKDGGAGFVYAFLRSGTVWEEKSKISLGKLRSYFGGDVFISGNHAVVGAPGWDDWAGSVYIYDCITDLSLPVEPKLHRPTTLGNEKSKIKGNMDIQDVEVKSQVPAESRLLRNYPNPFNPETWIPYQLSRPSDVTIRIYSQSGQSVRILNLGYKEEGIYLARSNAGYWDGRNDSGEPIASGVYFYQIEADGFCQTRKMTVMK